MPATLILLTIGIPWIGAVCIWMIGDRQPRLTHGLAVVASVTGGISALGLMGFIDADVALRFPLGKYFGDLTFIPDGLGVFLAAIATCVGSLAVIFSVDYMHGDAQLRRYYFLVLFFIGAMAGLALTGSLLALFIFWEITALCSYALISFYNDDPKAVAGGIKALIITQIGGIGLLIGAGIAYANFNTYEISVFLERAQFLPAGTLSIVAFGLLAAAAAKSAQFPFQTWLPDAMEAPTPVSALIHAATMVNAGVYLLARFFPACKDVPGWQISVIAVGAISALLTAVMALTATDLKRVLAYSTVSQLGYMFFAVGSGGIIASQFHLFSHALFKALLFLSAGAIIHTIGTRDMRQMGKDNSHMPFVHAAMIIGALALAGLPILNGFWSKELVLEAGLEGSPEWALVIMILVAGLTACYTFRFIWMVFFAPTSKADRSPHTHDAPFAMRIALTPLVLGALLSWLLIGPFSQFLAESLPFHKLHAEPGSIYLLDIIGAPITYLVLAVISLGLAAWYLHAKLGWLIALLQIVKNASVKSFGFEAVNSAIVDRIRAASDWLGQLQTGQLNWNLMGIIAGLAFVLAWLAFGL